MQSLVLEYRLDVSKLESGGFLWPCSQMANFGMLMEKMTYFEIVQMELWSLHYGD